MSPKMELPPTAGMPVSPLELVNLVAGPKTFSQDICKFLSVESVDFFSSATTALWIAFETVKRKTGRTHVVLPGYTCPLVAISAHNAGLKIRLCDLRPDSFELDLAHLERITDHSVAAIVPTDMAGLPCEVEGAKSIASKQGSYVIEDAAQAFGAWRGAKRLGSDADISIFSFAAGKGMSLVDGGVACTPDSDLRKLLKTTADELVKSDFGLTCLRNLQLLGYSVLYNPAGLKWIYGNDLRKALSTGDLVHAVGDYFELEQPNYKFCDWRLRLGARLMSRLPGFVESNRARAIARIELLHRETGVTVMQEKENRKGNWPFLFLLCKDQKIRNRIMSDLWTAGLGVSRLFIHELSGYDYLAPLLETDGKEIPNAKSLAERSFTITNSDWLDDATFRRIVDVVKSYAPVDDQASKLADEFQQS